MVSLYENSASVLDCTGSGKGQVNDHAARAAAHSRANLIRNLESMLSGQAALLRVI